MRYNRIYQRAAFPFVLIGTIIELLILFFQVIAKILSKKSPK